VVQDPEAVDEIKPPCPERKLKDISLKDVHPGVPPHIGEGGVQA